jgi:cyclopropane fatty-acyl-phospholipid synthase-like methyltransferase
MNETDRDRIAAQYDDMLGLYEKVWAQSNHQSIHSGYYGDDDDTNEITAMIRALARTTDVGPGDRVLNAGCGPGEDCAWLAQYRDADVVGVDVCEAEIERAEQYVSEHDVADQVTLRIDDFHELATVPENSVDVVWALESVCHATDTERVVGQFNRVLTDDGRVAIADLFRRPTDATDGETDRLDTVESAMTIDLDAIDDVRRTLADAGFSTVDATDVTPAVEPGMKTAYRWSFVMYPQLRVLQALGRATQHHVDHVRASYHLHKLLRAETIGYYFVTAAR